MSEQMAKRRKRMKNTRVTRNRRMRRMKAIMVWKKKRIGESDISIVFLFPYHLFLGSKTEKASFA